MTTWRGIPLGVAAVLGALGLRRRSRRRETMVDPDFVRRDPAEARVDREAQRRAMDVKYNDPGW